MNLSQNVSQSASADTSPNTSQSASQSASHRATPLLGRRNVETGTSLGPDYSHLTSTSQISQTSVLDEMIQRPEKVNHLPKTDEKKPGPMSPLFHQENTRPSSTSDAEMANGRDIYSFDPVSEDGHIYSLAKGKGASAAHVMAKAKGNPTYVMAESNDGPTYVLAESNDARSTGAESNDAELYSRVESKGTSEKRLTIFSTPITLEPDPYSTQSTNTSPRAEQGSRAYAAPRARKNVTCASSTPLTESDDVYSSPRARVADRPSAPQTETADIYAAPQRQAMHACSTPLSACAAENYAAPKKADLTHLLDNKDVYSSPGAHATKTTSTGEADLTHLLDNMDVYSSPGAHATKTTSTGEADLTHLLDNMDVYSSPGAHATKTTSTGEADLTHLLDNMDVYSSPGAHATKTYSTGEAQEKDAYAPPKTRIADIRSAALSEDGNIYSSPWTPSSSRKRAAAPQAMDASPTTQADDDDTADLYAAPHRKL